MRDISMQQRSHSAFGEALALTRLGCQRNDCGSFRNLSVWHSATLGPFSIGEDIVVTVTTTKRGRNFRYCNDNRERSSWPQTAFDVCATQRGFSCGYLLGAKQTARTSGLFSNLFGKTPLVRASLSSTTKAALHLPYCIQHWRLGDVLLRALIARYPVLFTADAIRFAAHSFKCTGQGSKIQAHRVPKYLPNVGFRLHFVISFMSAQLEAARYTKKNT